MGMLEAVPEASTVNVNHGNPQMAPEPDDMLSSQSCTELEFYMCATKRHNVLLTSAGWPED